MKNIGSVIMLLAIAGSLHAKSIHKVFGTEEKIIKNSGKIELYLIDMIPVMSIDQVAGQSYLYDYRITQTIPMKKKQALPLTKALLDTNQYLYDVNKKCPFMGKYAVSFMQGKRSVTIIISSEPCDKVIIFCPGSAIDKKHIDLVEKSSIVAAINQLLDQNK